MIGTLRVNTNLSTQFTMGFKTKVISHKTKKTDYLGKENDNDDNDYCKFGNFRDNFKRHICDMKNCDLGRIYSYRKRTERIRHLARILFSQNFAYMRSFAKIKPSQKFPNLHYDVVIDVGEATGVMVDVSS